MSIRKLQSVISTAEAKQGGGEGGSEVVIEAAVEDDEEQNADDGDDDDDGDDEVDVEMQQFQLEDEQERLEAIKLSAKAVMAAVSTAGVNFLCSELGKQVR